MAKYTPRLTAPTSDNAYYYANNPFYQSGFGLPNCTAYAYGRFWEITGGSRPALSLGNAEDWFGYSDGYKRGSTPKLGAVICWRRGTVGTDSDGAGHVAVVEAINDDGSIVTSESGWGSSLFWTTPRSNDGNWGQSSAYTFQGFIYNPKTFDGTGGETTDVPTPIGGNRYLSESEMENNAAYIWWYLSQRGWTANAVAGMLGNIQVESTMNPQLWESMNAGNTSGGYGLVQWTPATKLIEWANARNRDYTDINVQLDRIEYELENGLQYIATSSYPESFKEFKKSTADPRYLGLAFLANYERPADPNQPERGDYAVRWYEYITGLHFDGRTKRKGLSLLLMWAATRR